jgi:small redox-active disulfide protein 2
VSPAAVQIQILGMGCPVCRRMESDIKEIVQRLKLDAQVERVEDLEKILQFRLARLPGLIVDGHVIACGYPGKRKIEHLLTGLGQ